MATKADMRKMVLRRLGVLAVGEEPSADDAAVVDQAIDQVHAKLDAENVAYWESLTNLPQEMEIPFAMMVAAAVAPVFELDPGRVAFVEAQGSAGLNEIRTLAASTAVTLPVKTEYF